MRINSTYHPFYGVMTRGSNDTVCQEEITALEQKLYNDFIHNIYESVLSDYIKDRSFIYSRM